MRAFIDAAAATVCQDGTISTAAKIGIDDVAALAPFGSTKGRNSAMSASASNIEICNMSARALATGDGSRSAIAIATMTTRNTNGFVRLSILGGRNRPLAALFQTQLTMVLMQEKSQANMLRHLPSHEVALTRAPAKVGSAQLQLVRCSASLRSHERRGSVLFLCYGVCRAARKAFRSATVCGVAGTTVSQFNPAPSLL